MNTDSYYQSEIMTLTEVAGYLKLSEKTIHRMLRKQSIPCARVGGQWRFMKSVIDDWLYSQMQVLPRNDLARLLKKDGELVPVSRLMKQELVLTGLTGNNKQEILTNLITPLLNLGMIDSTDFFLQKLLERETMASTAIGEGIAMPHLRRPEENIIKEPVIVAGISKPGLEFAAFDHQPTHLFFLLITDSEAVHLRVMARLAALLKDQQFTVDLKSAPTAGAFLGRFIEQENRYLQLQNEYNEYK